MKNSVYIVQLIFLFLLSACGSQLRKPFCRESLSEFPTSVIGTYAVTIPKPDPSMNNATTFEQQILQITKNGVAYSAQIPQTPSLGGGSAFGSDSVCMVNGGLYLEKVNENSTYSVTRMETTASGLALSQLSFSVQDLQAQKIPFVVIPSLSIKQGTEPVWEQDWTLGSQAVIVDNTSIEPEELVKISKRASLYFTMTRVDAKLVGPTKFVSLKALAR